MHKKLDILVLIVTQVDSGMGEGSVIGVIPHDLMPREMSGAPIGDLRAVDTMHQRKVQLLYTDIAYCCMLFLLPSLVKYCL